MYYNKSTNVEIQKSVPIGTKIEISQKHKITKPVLQKENKVITAEIQSYYYSDDQIINHAIIEALYDYCLAYFSGYDSFSNTVKSEKFVVQLEKFHNHCKEINSNHPEFLLDNREAYYQNKRNKNPSDLLNLLVRSSLKLHKDYDQGINVIKQINYESPNILLVRNVKMDLYDFYIEFYSIDLFNLLETQNEAYVTSILMYAETLYACNQGAECGENSMELLLQCSINERFCGLQSYQEFINSKLTKSQQYDIKLVVGFLENLFDIEP